MSKRVFTANQKQLPIQLNLSVNSTFSSNSSVITNCGFDRTKAGLKTILQGTPVDFTMPNAGEEFFDSITAGAVTYTNNKIYYFTKTTEAGGDITVRVYEESITAGDFVTSIVLDETTYLLTNLEIYNLNGKTYIVFSRVNKLQMFNIKTQEFEDEITIGVLASKIFYDRQRGILWVLDQVNQLITGVKDGEIYKVDGVQFIIRLEKNVYWYFIFNIGTNIYALGKDKNTHRTRIIGHRGIINENVFLSETYNIDIVSQSFIDGKLYFLLREDQSENMNLYKVAYFNGRSIVTLSKTFATIMEFHSFTSNRDLKRLESWHRNSFIVRAYHSNKKRKSQLMEVDFNGRSRGLSFLTDSKTKQAYNVKDLITRDWGIRMYYEVFDHDTNTTTTKLITHNDSNLPATITAPASEYEIGPLMVPYQDYWFYQYKLMEILAAYEKELQPDEYIKLSIIRDWLDTDWVPIKEINGNMTVKGTGDSRDNALKVNNINNHELAVKIYLKIEMKGDIWLKNLKFLVKFQDKFKQ